MTTKYWSYRRGLFQHEGIVAKKQVGEIDNIISSLEVTLPIANTGWCIFIYSTSTDTSFLSTYLQVDDFEIFTTSM